MTVHQLHDRRNDFRKAVRRYSIFSWAAILLSLSEICLGIPSPAQSAGGNPSDQTTLPQAYIDAINDARLAEPNEIYHNLTPIVWYNPNLVWDRSRVLVAVWTTYAGYADRVDNLVRLPLDLWVTAAPDLQQFCKRYRPVNDVSLAYRLNQLLGLPPDSPEQSRYVVELWVEPRHLFRPSPDPGITDREAEPEFSLNEFEITSDGYQDWFVTQFNSRYPSTGRAYPWTQLGYTYDWGNQADWQEVDSNRPPHVGLSEFVIGQGALVTVRSAQSAEDYCR